MRIKILSSVIVLATMIYSCSKEYSIEGRDNTVINPPLGQNCKVNNIIAADSLTGAGNYSLFTDFDLAGLATRIVAYDSVNQQLDASANLTYKGDTIFITASDYFVTDANKRVVRFFTLADPGDPNSDTLIYNYVYNAGGYLSEKIITIPSILGTVVNFNYTWSNGNLVKVEGNTNVTGVNQKLLTATMTYDINKTAKNFIQVMPDNFESFFFVMAVDIGKKSTNVVSTISMITYDEFGVADQSYNTVLKNLVFSPDGYLTEWYAEGDSFDALGLFSGRTLFQYKCY